MGDDTGRCGYLRRCEGRDGAVGSRWRGAARKLRGLSGLCSGAWTGG